MTHTPGPWSVHKTDKCFIHDKNGKSITAINSNIKRPIAEKEANAKLIAAAPDLLDALNNIFNGVDTGVITSDHDETFANATQRARAAIAKATQ